jgi:hypothetical protein
VYTVIDAIHRQTQRKHDLPASSASYAFFAGAVALIFIALASFWFGSLFLLIEYRDFNDPANAVAIMSLFSVKSIQFSRTFGLFTDGSLAAAFGQKALLHNLFQICLLAGSALLLSGSLRRLLSRAPTLLVCAAMVFLLFGTPVMDSLTWQATILDKLCLFFSALGTFYIAGIDLRSIDLRKMASVNLVTFVITVCAYNSKESSFALVPSLLLLVVARKLGSIPSLAGLVEGFRDGCKLLALPIFYAALHVVIVLQNILTADAGQRAHDMGASVNFTFYHFTAYFFNLVPILSDLHLWPYAPYPVLTAFILFGTVSVITIGWFIIRYCTPKIAALWCWALISFMMSFAISIRAAGIPAYYMLVPQFYLSICLFFTVAAALERLRRRTHVIALQATCAILGIAYLCGFIATSTSYLRTATLSDNFTAALKQVKGYLSTVQTPAQSITFLWLKDDDWNAYMFLGTASHHHLAPYISDSKSAAELDTMDNKITDAQYESMPRIHPHKNQIVVILGEHLRLDRIIAGPSRPSKT